MKNIVKTAGAFAAAAALLCSAGCANTKWAFESDSDTVSNGMWILCTFNSASEAYSKVSTASSESSADSDTDFEDKEIDGQCVKDWIYDNAKKNALEYLALQELADEKDIELDDSMTDLYKNYYKQMYDSYESSYDKIFSDLGVSSDSFWKINTYPSMIKSELFTKLYGKDGELEVKDDELKTYFKENYVSYYYISVDLTTKDADNNTISVTDETKAKYEQFFKKYANMLNNNGNSTDDVTKQYKVDFELTDSQTPPSVSKDVLKSGLSEDKELDKLILDTKEKTAETKTIDSTLYLVYRYDISEKADTIKSAEAEEEETGIDRDSVLQNMKKDDFDKYINDYIEKFDYSSNDACLDKYSVGRTISIMRDKNLLP